MKVKECKNCPYNHRRTWSHEYKPAGYHTIGMTHAYAWCTKHGKRVSEVKQCKENKNNSPV